VKGRHISFYNSLTRKPGVFEPRLRRMGSIFRLRMDREEPDPEVFAGLF